MFMRLNLACNAAGVSEYTVDLLAITGSLPSGLVVLADSACLPTSAHRELVRLLSARGFELAELSSASVSIDVLRDGDGSMFGIRTTLVRHGRRITRALDPSGRVVSAA
jgi:hypothetical protein